MAKVTDKQINDKGREVALRLDYLMAIVDKSYNRHQKCMVCKEKFMHHIDGLPCISDTVPKEIVKHK